MPDVAVIDRFGAKSGVQLDARLGHPRAPVVKQGTYWHSFLSNFYPCRIKWEGLVYPSLENAYQAAKATLREIREPFTEMTPAQSKRAGRELRRRGHQREDWMDVNLAIMEWLIQQKFTIHDGLRVALLDTGDAELIEGNDWNDDFFGMIQVAVNGGLNWSWRGENNLGKMLMRTRGDIRFVTP